MVSHFVEVRLPAKQLKQFSTTCLYFIDVTLDFFLSSRRYFTHEYNNMMSTGRIRYPLPNTTIITVLIIYALN